MKIDRIHHVAYRCRDAKETVEWYRQHLDMEFVLAIAEDNVPSTGAPDPYMHVFLDAGHGNVLAFFELPNSPAQGKDPNTPEWVQHIASRWKASRTWKRRKPGSWLPGCPWSARPITPSFAASISSTPTATGWSSPWTWAHLSSTGAWTR